MMEIVAYANDKKKTPAVENNMGLPCSSKDFDVIRNLSGKQERYSGRKKRKKRKKNKKKKKKKGSNVSNAGVT